MLFTSISFYFFAFIALMLVRALPFQLSRWLLIIASYFFYGTAEPWYCAILLSSTLIDYFVAQKIFQSEDASVRKRWLLLSLVGNLSLLCLFKYANFAAENLNFLIAVFGEARLPYLDLILPIGISFYTFQTLSYTIDVYRRKQVPTKNFAAFALYVAFFPQLVAGPIERARNLLVQFEMRFRASREDIEYGIQRILWGVAKKVIFADRFALVVAGVYRDPSSHTAPEAILATLCFSFQLYLDFSAYTDIAIGLASLFGIRLSENFNYPFLARNPSDFWSRWHITLTNWFRDYVYTAVGGTKRSAPIRTAVAVMIVMGLMGLWHGAEWHFVMFGLLSGLMVVFYVTVRLWSKKRRLLGDSWLATVVSVLIMNVVINLIMVFFRAKDLETALQVIFAMVNGGWGLEEKFTIPAAMLAVVIVAHMFLGTRGWSIHRLNLGPIKKGLLCAVLFLSINFLATNMTEQFVYFRF